MDIKLLATGVALAGAAGAWYLKTRSNLTITSAVRDVKDNSIMVVADTNVPAKKLRVYLSDNQWYYSKTHDNVDTATSTKLTAALKQFKINGGKVV